MTRRTPFLDAVCENIYNTYNKIRHCLRSDQKITNKRMPKTSGQLLPCARQNLYVTYTL